MKLVTNLLALSITMGAYAQVGQHKESGGVANTGATCNTSDVSGTKSLEEILKMDCDLLNKTTGCVYKEPKKADADPKHQEDLKKLFDEAVVWEKEFSEQIKKATLPQKRQLIEAALADGRTSKYFRLMNGYNTSDIKNNLEKAKQNRVVLSDNAYKFKSVVDFFFDKSLSSVEDTPEARAKLLELLKDRYLGAPVHNNNPRCLPYITDGIRSEPTSFFGIRKLSSDEIRNFKNAEYQARFKKEIEEYAVKRKYSMKEVQDRLSSCSLEPHITHPTESQYKVYPENCSLNIVNNFESNSAKIDLASLKAKTVEERKAFEDCVKRNKENGFVQKSVDVNASSNAKHNAAPYCAKGFLNLSQDRANSAKNILKDILPSSVDQSLVANPQVSFTGNNGDGTSGPCPYSKNDGKLPEYAAWYKNYEKYKKDKSFKISEQDLNLGQQLEDARSVSISVSYTESSKTLGRDFTNTEISELGIKCVTIQPSCQYIRPQ